MNPRDVIRMDIVLEALGIGGMRTVGGDRATLTLELPDNGYDAVRLRTRHAGRRASLLYFAEGSAFDLGTTVAEALAYEREHGAATAAAQLVTVRIRTGQDGTTVVDVPVSRTTWFRRIKPKLRACDDPSSATVADLLHVWPRRT